MNAEVIAWLVTLIVVILLVPVAIALLHRTLRAALSIERHLQDTEKLAASIVNHTAVAPALIDTADHARAMRASGENLEQLGAMMADTLTGRAAQGGKT